MLPQSYEFSHVLCLNNFLQVLLIGYERYQGPLLRYINWGGELSDLVMGKKVLWDMKYLMSSVKQAVEAVGIWTEDNWDVKRVNSLYTMISGWFNLKINKRFYSFIWPSVVRGFYTRRGDIII